MTGFSASGEYRLIIRAIAAERSSPSAKPGLDLPAVAAQHIEGPTGGQRVGGHRTTDDDPGDRDDRRTGELRDPQPENDRQDR